MKKISGQIVDLHAREIYSGSVYVSNGLINKIVREEVEAGSYITVGFVDAHVHIESSALTPEVFGFLAIQQGTVAIVTDPHEIANVMGVKGIEFMIENSELSPIKTFFTIPSCVPATPFDASGASISAQDVETLAASGRFVALSEVMNVPGVLYRDSELMAKLESAKRHGLPIDGHAPLLCGEQLAQYVDSGITTDHECSTLEEALEKISCGMMIQIREGSAACNYNILSPLLKEHSSHLMFCTDDSHPDDVMEDGEINKIVKRAVADGYDIFDVLRVASINAINHYTLDVGQLREGDKADFIVVDNLHDFKVLEVYIEGEERYNHAVKSSEIIRAKSVKQNNFNHEPISISSLAKKVESSVKCISIIEGELITKLYNYEPLSASENLESDVSDDLLKLVYINRYENGTPQVSYIKGFGLKRGAFASSIAHDSHNIVAVGVTDKELALAINTLITTEGGLVVACGESVSSLALPVAGIISDKGFREVASSYQALTQQLHTMGCVCKSPFMTLSFMSLPVIPEVKIGEKGLFDYNKFNWME